MMPFVVDTFIVVENLPNYWKLVKHCLNLERKYRFVKSFITDL